jgi:superfamily II DNA or RNA helicase
MLEVIIDNRLRLNYKELPKEAYKELKDTLTYKNPDYSKYKRLGYNTKGTPQFITSYTIDSPTQMSIGRGASYKLKEVCRKHDIKINFVDKRLSLPYKFDTIIKLRDYQFKPCNQLVKFQSSLIQGVCGCGKTVILLKAIEEIGQKTLIIVHESKLQQQWVDNIKEFFGLEDDEIGIIGGIAKKPRVRPITVAMQQSLLKSADKYKNEFGCVVGDEVHRFAASTFQSVINAFPAKYRIGATATPKRKDGKHYLVFDQFGKIVSRITDDDLLAMDMTHDVKIVIVKTEFEYTGKMESKTNRSFKGIGEDGKAEYDETTIEYVNNNELLEQLIMDKERNNLIYRFLKAEVENNHYCILLADRRRFCLNWQRWLGHKDIEAKLLVGGAEHKEEGDEAIRRIMGDGDLHVVIGTTVADEGLDIKRLDRGFSATPTATNERRIVQQAGRIKRKCDGKDDAIWYYFLDYKVKGFDKHIKLLQKYFRTVEVLDNAAEIEEYLYHQSPVKET